MSGYRWVFFVSFLGCAVGLSVLSQSLLADEVHPPAPIAEPTGRFALTQRHGRHLLVTPEGHPFVAIGVNHIGAAAGVLKDIDWQQIRTSYEDWGCTTVGTGSGPELPRHVPYIVGKDVLKTSKYYTGPTGRNPYDYADVFDPAQQQAMRRVVQRLCQEHRDDPLLVGYCWTDTPCWDIVRTRALRRTDWVSEIRLLSADAPGKRRYVQFLQERFEDDIEAFGEAYELHADSFGALLDTDFSLLDTSRIAVLTDDQAFLGHIARQFYETVGSAQREFDPRHLVFGERYLAGDYPDEVLTAAAPWIDVLSIQPGDGYIDVYPPSDRFLAGEFDRLHQLTDKPIFICDHQISFPTREHPQTTWTQRSGESDAADATHRFILDAFARPYVVGYMRCQYIDVPDKRRRALKQGLLRGDGTPYETLLTAFRDANLEVLRQLREDWTKP